MNKLSRKAFLASGLSVPFACSMSKPAKKPPAKKASSVKLGISRFGNPFASLPLRQSRALFEHYVDNDFQPLSNATVQAILLEADSAMPTGR